MTAAAPETRSLNRVALIGCIAAAWFIWTSLLGWPALHFAATTLALFGLFARSRSRFMAAAALIGALGLGGYQQFFNVVHYQDPSPSTAAPSSAAAYSVTARELFDDFQANEVRANGKYKGNSIKVSGVVSRIGTDIADTPYVALEVGDPVFSVQAMFRKSDAGRLTGLSIGDQVIIQGRCDGKLGNVLLRNSSLLR